MKWLIAILALMLLVTACATKTVESDPNLKIVEEEEEPGFEVIELRFVDEKFDPNTIVVEEGTRVRIVFMNDELITFSLQEYGIAEKAGPDNFVEFTADKKGSFGFECTDCDTVATGLLRVV